MRLPLYLTSLCLLGAAGWVAGYLSLPQAPPEPLPPPAPGQETAALSPAATDATAGTAGGALIAELSAVARRRSAENHEIDARLFEHLEKLSSAEIGAFAMQLGEVTNVRLSDRARFVVLYWMDRDFPAAREWLKNAPRSVSPPGEHTIVQRWAKEDPEELLAWMESLPEEDKLSRLSRATSASVEIFASQHAERLLASILKVPPNFDGERIMGRLFAAWARTDPAAAGARALRLPGEGMKSEAVAGVAATWAESDPKASLEWVANLPDAVLAHKAQSGLIRGMAAKDPAVALEHLADLPLTVESQKLMREVVATWTEKDPAATLRWADNLRDEGARQVAYESLLWEQGVMKLDQTMEILLARADVIAPSASYYETLVGAALRRHGPKGVDAVFAKLPENHRTAAGEAVIARLRDKPAELEQWAALQAEGDLRAHAYSMVASRKFALNGAEAVRWAESLGKGTSRDAVVERLAQDFSSQQPDEAVKVARLMSDPESAERLAASYFSEWHELEPAQAAEWLRTTKLISADRKPALLKNQ